MINIYYYLAGLRHNNKLGDIFLQSGVADGETWHEIIALHNNIVVRQKK